MTAPRPPYRSAFPFWALLLWLAVGLSASATRHSPRQPSSPALVDDGGLFGQALPRDAGGQWQRRDSGDDPVWDAEPDQGPLATLALTLPGTASPPRAVAVPAPAPRFPLPPKRPARAPSPNRLSA